MADKHKRRDPFVTDAVAIVTGFGAGIGCVVIPGYVHNRALDRQAHDAAIVDVAADAKSASTPLTPDQVMADFQHRQGEEKAARQTQYEDFKPKASLLKRGSIGFVAGAAAVEIPVETSVALAGLLRKRRKRREENFLPTR